MTVINTNYLALVSQNNLRTSKSALGSAIERLSSGLRINNSKDDAAGMAIANRMTAQIRGMTQAARNANDGISLAQTAEGNLKEINGNLQRIRELAVQAANDTNSENDRKAINTEIAQRMSEIDRIAKSADFNGTKLLDEKGSGGAAQQMERKVSFHVGANTDETQDVITIDQNTLIDATLAGLELTDGGDNNNPPADGGNTALADSSKAADAGETAESARKLIEKIDKAMGKVDTGRANLGAIQNRFESTINNLNNTINNLSASRSRIEDADYAVEVSNMTRAQILQQAGTSVLAQANQVPQTVLSLLR